MHANTIPSTHKNEDNATELEGGAIRGNTPASFRGQKNAET